MFEVVRGEHQGWQAISLPQLSAMRDFRRLHRGRAVAVHRDSCSADGQAGMLPLTSGAGDHSLRSQCSDVTCYRSLAQLSPFTPFVASMF